ncbi:MAG TPA: hypothetical protein VMH05_05365 [Bryobacteraceae bacterium]|nr:hypothetical protein [Bryobacteraceae bacterium]
MIVQRFLIQPSAIWIFLGIAAAAIGQTSTPQQPPQTAVSPAPAQTQTTTLPEIGPDQSWSFELFYWLTQANPDQKTGAAATDFETLGSLGKSKPAPGAELSLRLTSNDVLRVSVFQMHGNGTTTASQALDLFTTAIAAGDYLATTYTISAAKVSFEDLLYPFPVRGRKLRFKTLWEVQAAKIYSRVDAPFDTSLVASSGAGAFPSATGQHYVVLPAFGGALQYAASPKLYMDVRASGFGIPHHQDTLDAEASIGYRIGQVQIVAGGKLYKFKTSPQSTEYFTGMISGGYVGLRWVGAR